MRALWRRTASSRVKVPYQVGLDSGARRGCPLCDSAAKCTTASRRRTPSRGRRVLSHLSDGQASGEARRAHQEARLPVGGPIQDDDVDVGWSSNSVNEIRSNEAAPPVQRSSWGLTPLRACCVEVLLTRSCPYYA